MNDDRFNAFENRIGRVEERLGKVENRLTRIESHTESIMGSVDGIAASLDSIKLGNENHKIRLEHIEERSRSFNRVLGSIAAIVVASGLIGGIFVKSMMGGSIEEIKNQVQAIEK